MKSIQKISLRVTREKLGEESAAYARTPVVDANSVVKILAGLIGEEPQEVFLCLHLDTKHRVLAYTEVGRGSISGCFADPREVFRAAIVSGASAIILSHNHPSGDCAPSLEDNTVTTRLRKAGELLGIKVLDHVIIGAGKHFSYLDSGMFGALS